jgi:ParB family transcriptional regulator, chromosome partitioning protein
MSLKDTLTSRLGDRMRASMGAGEIPTGGTAAAVPPGTTRPAAAGKTDGLKALRTAALIPLDRLTPDPDQPRKTFSNEEIDRLADSLRSRGMLQPIRARWDADLARWIIVAGERRFRAARRAGWSEVPCMTTDGPLTASEILVDQLVENCLREDLAPLEQGAAFQALMDANGWSARRLAEELHISHQSVIRAVGLLELPAEVRDRVESGELSPRAAAEIATLEHPEDQRAVADLAVSGALNRDQVADVVKARKEGRPAPARPGRRVVKLPDGHKVTIEGPAAEAGDEAVAELLAKARKQVLREMHGRGRGVGRSPGDQAGDQAA